METTKAQIKIEKIVIKHIVDENPDLSYLGEYSNTPAKVSIDRKERGDMERNEYRYFNLGCGDAAYIEQDYARMEAANKGDWHSIGIVVEAHLSREINGGCKRLETLSSGGLWGIESDSDKAYIEEVENEQLADLKEHLAAFNVDLSNFDNIEIEHED